MRDLDGHPASELERAIDARRLAEQIDALLLQAFSADELAAIPADLRKVLDMLIKRRMAVAGKDLSLADMLGVRQQFEDYAESRVGDPIALRLAAQLR